MSSVSYVTTSEIDVQTDIIMGQIFGEHKASQSELLSLEGNHKVVSIQRHQEGWLPTNLHRERFRLLQIGSLSNTNSFEMMARMVTDSGVPINRLYQQLVDSI